MLSTPEFTLLASKDKESAGPDFRAQSVLVNGIHFLDWPAAEESILGGIERGVTISTVLSFAAGALPVEEIDDKLSDSS